MNIASFASLSWPGHFAAFADWLGFNQQRCSHCGAPYFFGELERDFASPRLCPKCQPGLAQYSGPACHLCGLPDHRLNKAGLCQQCAKEQPPWQGLAFYGLYEASLRDLILRLKYDAELQIIHTLADFLLQACQALPAPDFMLAIPQHPVGLRKRGFNQAHELAARLARLTGFRLDSRSLWRTRLSVPQEALGAQARRRNLIGAFQASAAVAGSVIWLLDDVMTTGSTCAEATKALLAAGAKQVHALFVARTPLV